ncbi:signal transduction histidine kinase/CHASE1-domain containing sensor protein [Actinoplanes lutulentus]|uniref:Sensor-like histidine kinase SenX3 n=1 Tax=Actinoplanes lutulentus TaxID=1287878 RepID=A0A327ZDJ7_9ACTN|nr:ATP-binding protein [Actinoplanes lutulentus]MBB2941324.1 signal transduction histidine kinase/CHASE1-domain containing sensor protein [Actinoplanes lutulentus]RAK36816.1 signal transduction histidine kinase [Actinoplanes lutulentus]
MSRKRPGAAVLSALVAVVGCAVTLVVSVTLARREEAAAEVQMDRRTSAAADAVRTETRRYVDILRSTAAGAGGQEELTGPEFGMITQPLKTMRLAGANGIVLVVPAGDDDVAAVQERWRKLGMAGLVLDPKGHGDHAFVVTGTTLDDSRPTGGLDLAQAEAPASALDAARRSGQVAVSDSYHLLTDLALPAERRQNSFILASPVYRGSEQQFLGWVVLGVRGQNFMGDTFELAGQGLLDLTLSAAGTDRRELAVAELDAAGKGKRDLQRAVDIPVADKIWTLRVAANAAALPGVRSALPLAVIVGGLLLTGVLTSLVWVLATSRDRARVQVRTATAELRAGETASRRQAELLSAVLDGISDGVGVVGPDGKFLLHNPAAIRMLGRSDPNAGVEGWQDHYGLFLVDGVTPFATDEIPLVKALGGESSRDIEMLVRHPEHPDGRVISVSAQPIETSAGERGAVAVFHDITERKNVEIELRGFAGVVAHDLKSPLTSVRGYAELITDALDELEAGHDAAALAQARRGSEKVINGALRMQQLITELLDYAAARDATLRLNDVNLRSLVDDVVTARTDNPDGSTVRPDIFVGALPEVQADPVLLRQVIDNLVGNAIKYTPPGQAPRIDITGRAEPDGDVRVQIADRGIGIPDGEHALVFDSFHRASNGVGHPGTGLGLAICRRIVERHGGRIEAAPNPGGGTIFAFTLPATSLTASIPVGIV